GESSSRRLRMSRRNHWSRCLFPSSQVRVEHQQRVQAMRMVRRNEDISRISRRRWGNDAERGRVVDPGTEDVSFQVNRGKWQAETPAPQARRPFKAMWGGAFACRC